MNSRALAIHCLVVQEQSREPVDQVLAALLGQHPLPDDRDRQLAMALIYGVLRHRQELDAVLQDYSKTALPKLRPAVLQALRCGLAQLLFMDRIPPSAVVNETVQGLGRQPKWLKGFVNGVLRAMVRDMEGVRHCLASLPPEKKLNHPGWLVALWEGQFGVEQTRALCLANNGLPPLSLRLNPHRQSRADFLDQLKARGISGQAGRYGDQAVVMHDFHGRVDSLPGYQEGRFHVQDEAAQLIAPFFEGLPSGAYLDGCAGLGGKSILLDQILPADASLTAVDPHAGRLSLLRDNLERCHCRPISLHTTTLQDFARDHGERFMGVLVDAPCSGLGVIGRQPDIRWNRREKELARLAATQLEILLAAARLVDEGGVLVYCTCSLSTTENEAVIAAFLQTHPAFAILPPRFCGPAQELVTRQGFLRTLPTDGLDGFFVARLVKT
ncbi:MAG: 16S rRNA (cytosine(967)-C(5))-methyltransferase RsmB [Deltaproteobacteria bacterium]|jgi:16S rRNA (cytosine967-C5)-methyltransferase|nr:16S rRNA (cytosine(967)-C(5))-methyltransferase RsmB [Deltaproteobacteria bacterium]